MMKRRNFLKTTTMGTAAAVGMSTLGPLGCATNRQTTPASRGETGGSGGGVAAVPDTLDMAEIAGLGLRGITGFLDPEHDYEPYSGMFFGTAEPYLQHMRFAMDCAAKLWESFPYLRSVTGSENGREIEEGFTKAMLSHQAEDGLFYSGYPQMTPWHNVNPPGQTYHAYPMDKEPYANIIGNARSMLAMMAYHQQDGDAVWLRHLQAASDGLRRIAVIENDHAYFPDGSIGTAFSHPMSGWRNTVAPDCEHFGGEGSVMCYYGQVLRAVTRWSMLSGDERALDLARRLVTFCQRPQMWAWEGEASPKEIVVAEQAAFKGHVHGHLAYLRGVLEYAVATDNMRLKEFVRSGYEWTRKKGLARIGCFGEGCAVADMVALAIRLSDAGMGDWWDDVSQYTRNQLVEMQFSDEAMLRNVAENSPLQPNSWDLPIPGINCRVNAIERGMGTISGGATPTDLSPIASICCTGNGSNALYYAWESILREEGDSVQVNLLMNRASASLDVASWLPHEGRVELHNKAARRVAVRLPGWLDGKSPRFTVNGNETTPMCAGNYAVFTGLKPGQVIGLEFPMKEETAVYQLDTNWWVNYYNQDYKPTPNEYTCRFQGDTCLSVQGSATNPKGYLIYQRELLGRPQTKLKKTAMHVPKVIFRW
jgi:hypothetical protein